MGKYSRDQNTPISIVWCWVNGHHNYPGERIWGKSCEKLCTEHIHLYCFESLKEYTCLNYNSIVTVSCFTYIIRNTEKRMDGTPPISIIIRLQYDTKLWTNQTEGAIHWNWFDSTEMSERSRYINIIHVIQEYKIYTQILEHRYKNNENYNEEFQIYFVIYFFSE